MGKLLGEVVSLGCSLVFPCKGSLLEFKRHRSKWKNGTSDACRNSLINSNAADFCHKHRSVEDDCRGSMDKCPLNVLIHWFSNTNFKESKLEGPLTQREHTTSSGFQLSISFLAFRITWNNYRAQNGHCTSKEKSAFDCCNLGSH